ncbi:hypothetical protein GCM10022215_08030 [Nocardioides fonticola]|uniref:Putative zinc-finger domain-containing protein n=1 Tax=Nocardioides fonticola TaxID=450363 RepID=A0ABP7XCX1_9ACTN
MSEQDPRSDAGFDHDEWHGLVGAHALGHLEGPELDRLQAHLDGCAACRADLRDLAPLSDLLVGLDPEAYGVPAAPPADLGARIREAVAAEPPTGRGPTPLEPTSVATAAPDLVAARPVGGVPSSVPARRPAAVRVLAVAAAVVVAAGIGGVVGRASAPEPPTPPLERVEVRAVAGAEGPVAIASSELIAHTWGVELILQGRGFVEGETYRASFRTTGGTWRPAGAFRGTGAQPLLCRLQSAVLRDAVDAVRIVDDRGRVVARARIVPRTSDA